jgi:hypothetical protein
MSDRVVIHDDQSSADYQTLAAIHPWSLGNDDYSSILQRYHILSRLTAARVSRLLVS